MLFVLDDAEQMGQGCGAARRHGALATWVESGQYWDDLKRMDRWLFGGRLTRLAALHLCAEPGNESGLKLLLACTRRFITGPAENRSYEILAAIGVLGPKIANPMIRLVRKSKLPANEERAVIGSAAVRFLGHIRPSPPAVLETLREVIQGKGVYSSEVRYCALAGLEVHKWKEAMPWIVAVAEEEDELICFGAAKTLGIYPPRRVALPTLTRLARDGPGDLVRCEALAALRKYHDLEPVLIRSILSKAQSDPNDRVATKAKALLDSLPDDDVR
jgi:hypothetical protein